MPSTSERSTVEQLRAERDRFVAFAFSAADMLLELDDQSRVVYAVGATAAMAGHPPERLVGMNILDLIAVADHAFVGELLAQAGRGKRIEPVLVQFADGHGDSGQLVMSGYRMSDLSDHYFLSFRTGRPLASQAARDAKRDPDSGLVDAESFLGLVGEAATGDPDGDQESNVTLVSLDGYEAFRAQLSDEAAKALVGKIGAQLRACSVDGLSAGQLGPDKYGVLSGPAADPAALADQIHEATVDADPNGVGLDVASTAVEIGDEALGEEDMLRAIAYTFNQFAKAPHGTFDIGNLNESYESMVRDSVDRITSFRDIVNGGDFAVAYQPIVELESGAVHHFEALARFESGDKQASPYETIVFAEDLGMIGDFDLAMCKRVVETVEKQAAAGREVSIAVNISTRSLGSRLFVDSMQAVLARHRKVRKRILFEVTESSEIDDLSAIDGVIQEFRRAGHAVCLDDFGAGAAAFQYLRALKVDLVKIDGAYVRDALTDPGVRAFLKAMTGLCGDLGIDTVGEMIEDQATAKFLIDNGVRYGQGYFYGRPDTALADMLIAADKSSKPKSESRPAMKTGRIRRRKSKITGWE
ncbi:MAG: EAL domain-containing protein [Alphaproteobacteria bacterium]|jgi:PAS domain S-box-containing protein|nr:EAL domain-containing protein [Alphaproteobacteria bacterium]MDP6517406.1 EAL domain-containing protein [Alphaproteobacteria bacterium]